MARWNPELMAQMDAIGAKHGRVWRDDERDQWSNYAGKDDVDGTGRVIKAYTGGELDPYWQERLGMHATGDYYGNGTTPDAVGQAQMAAQRAALTSLMGRPSGIQSVAPTGDRTQPGEAGPTSKIDVTVMPEVDVTRGVPGLTPRDALRAQLNQSRPRRP